MTYITGDCHFKFDKIEEFCSKKNTTKNDIMIILGDACVNYYQDSRDIKLKKRLEKLPITLFFIYGNHEIRPENLPEYKVKEWLGNEIYEEERFPSLKFAIDGNTYEIDNKKFLVIGGAYSVDKYYRVGNGLLWMSDEQPSKEIFEKAYRNIENNKNKVDIILTHTCPFSYIPQDRLCTDIDPRTIDTRTEKRLDKLMKNTNFDKWYCGHFHIDRKVGKIIFMNRKIQNI